MKTVGTKKTNTKTKIKFQKGIRKEKSKNTKERKINNKMNKFETMVIPIEADGIVDDEKAFKDQQKENEAQLKQEIKSAKTGDELYINDYEDIEFVESGETDKSEGELKRAKRKPVLAHRAYGIFARLAS